LFQLYTESFVRAFEDEVCGRSGFRKSN